ncbi:MAG: fibronectin type III domain-containing protein, partial [Nitrospiria bacterium]
MTNSTAPCTSTTKAFHSANLRRFLGSLISLMMFIALSAKAFAGEATLSWSPNTEVDLAGYKVYFGNASRTYGTPITLGNQTSYTVTGLGLGTYFFAVTAFDGAGNESTFSAEVSKTFADLTPPAISAISAGGISN